VASAPELESITGAYFASSLPAPTKKQAMDMAAAAACGREQGTAARQMNQTASAPRSPVRMRAMVSTGVTQTLAVADLVGAGARFDRTEPLSLTMSSFTTTSICSWGWKSTLLVPRYVLRCVRPGVRNLHLGHVIPVTPTVASASFHVIEA